jgi:hypothetical protein
VMFSKLFELKVGEERNCKNAIVGFAKRRWRCHQEGRHYMMGNGLQPFLLKMAKPANSHSQSEWNFRLRDGDQKI